ncbi:MAG: RNA polymerase sigma factor [Gammaproteobacteria bacterium]|nr:RNA polymerase sigma factor [Gammaproteobacteria bacterium]
MKPNQAQAQALDRFLAGVERRALVMAELSCGNRDEALDLVQEAMSRFVRAYGHKPEVEWPPLFYRTLQNQVRDWYRRAAVARRHLQPNPADEEGEEDWLERLPGQVSLWPDRQLEQAAAMECLIAGVARLPERQRQALLLRIWEGLDVAETASAMGCSQGSVKTHLSRALQALRTQLEDHWQ